MNLSPSAPSSLRSLLHPSFVLMALLLLVSPRALHAFGTDEILPDEQGLAQLQIRAEQAKPREQCFLYAELVHTMTEIAGRQMLAGDVEHASATLKRVEHYAQLIHLGLANDTKRLKNTEMLMHQTTHKLGEFLHMASSEDKETLQATLKHLNQVQDELLVQVFAH